MNIYRADCRFLDIGSDGNRYEKSILKDFKSPNRVKAVRAIMRWVKRIQKRAPDAYGTFLNMQVFDYHIMPIDANGDCKTDCIRFFDWKCDYPGTLEQEIQALENKEKKRSKKL